MSTLQVGNIEDLSGNNFTNVRQIKVYEESTNVVLSATSLTNVQNSLFNFTPVSDDSTIIVDYSFGSNVNNTAGQNAIAVYAIGDGTSSISVGYNHSAVSASGGLGAYGTQNIKIFLPNTSFNILQFSLMGSMQIAGQSANVYGRRCVITEIV